MICKPCAAAADLRAPRNQHCDDPGCTCGHKAERYGTTTTGAQQPIPGADDSPCTATLATPYTDAPLQCTGTARHYDESTMPDWPHPGGWHHTTDGLNGSPSVWADTADGATPHADTTTED